MARAHKLKMEQIGNLDAWTGTCKCGWEAGPDTAYEIDGAWKRHLRAVGA